MEIGDHGIYDLKAIARGDEEACAALVSLDVPTIDSGNTLQHAHRCCAHGNDTAASFACFCNEPGSWRIQLDLFAVHLVLTDIFALDRTEGVQSHMEGHEANPHSLLAQLLQQVGGEVQAGSGSSSRAADARVDGLITLRVGQPLVDIGWKGRSP